MSRPRMAMVNRGYNGQKPTELSRIHAVIRHFRPTTA